VPSWAAGRDRPKTVARTLGVMSRPSLAVPSRPDIERLYGAALTTLLDVDIVDTGAGAIVTAGGGYPEPWTRDASINSVAAVSLLAPDVARRTLLSVCGIEPDGTGIVAQDDQWWDQIIWVLGAWHHAMVSGDRQFLATACRIGVATAARLRSQHFDPIYELYQGPAVMQDGISGFPSPPADPRNGSSFVLDHPDADRIMCLSTNGLYARALRALAAMAREVGEDGDVYLRQAEDLTAQIQARFWDADRQAYGYLIHGSGPAEGRLEPYQEALGLAFALRWGLVPADRVPAVLAGVVKEPAGISNVHPSFARFDVDHPGRHNLMCWPMVMAVWADALAHVGDWAGFSGAVEDLVRLFAGSNEACYELYHPVTGAVDGGWQIGRQWESQPDQTWSASTFLGLIHHRVLGLRIGWEGISLRPVMPEGWGPVTLRDLPYRDAVLDVTVEGEGPDLIEVNVDGHPASAPVIVAGTGGRHTVTVQLG
jgi:glycogen debranching enzyme